MKMNLYRKEPELMYVPGEERGKASKQFRSTIERKYGVKFENYWDFHKWSVENISQFWEEIWLQNIIYSKNFDEVLDLNKPLWELEWFRGARLNYAENLLKYRDDRVAIIAAGEDRETSRYTYTELYEQVCRYTEAFRKAGLQKGDVVACYMSNRPEAIFAMAAVVSIGGIWTGALPLIGAKAVITKLDQMKPKFLITTDRFQQNKEEIEMLHKIKDIAEGLNTLVNTIIVPSKENSKLKDISDIKNSIFLDDFLAKGTSPTSSAPDIVFEQVSFSHPVFVNFTSGTTGLPKAIVHGSGVLLSLYRDFVLHMDSDRDSTWFSVSPVGWASWAIFTTVLSIGSTLIVYEGVPFFLQKTYTIWDLVDEYRITHLFVTPSAVEEVEKQAQSPKGKNHLKSLKMIFAGGSVVKPQTYDFIYANLPKHVMFSSSYGGTEFLGMCLMIEGTLPIHRGEIPSSALGNNVCIFNENGEKVKGEMGDVIITTPSPNFLVRLWGDSDNSICKEKYFSKQKGGICIGDFGIENPITKGFVVCCRSDETLKQRGCRFGSVEIYGIVNGFPEIHNSLCVSHYSKSMDESAVLFLKMRPSNRLDPELVQKIRDTIARELTVRHVPDIILEAPDIPMSINGKKMELLVKGIINNLPYNSEMIVNPESLEFFYNVPELQNF